jgi:hypothetical protein
MNRAKQGIQPSDQSAFVSSGGYKISNKNLEIKTVPFRCDPGRRLHAAIIASSTVIMLFLLHGF